MRNGLIRLLVVMAAWAVAFTGASVGTASMSFGDRLLMGQYPTGRIFAYDGQTIVDQENWPPVLNGVVPYSRDAQTTGTYGGYLYVGRKQRCQESLIGKFRGENKGVRSH
jgi:hypothetical protein